jgi:hypothetical protein
MGEWEFHGVIRPKQSGGCGTVLAVVAGIVVLGAIVIAVGKSSGSSAASPYSPPARWEVNLDPAPHGIDPAPLHQEAVQTGPSRSAPGHIVPARTPQPAKKAAVRCYTGLVRIDVPERPNGGCVPPCDDGGWCPDGRVCTEATSMEDDGSLGASILACLKR